MTGTAGAVSQPEHNMYAMLSCAVHHGVGLLSMCCKLVMLSVFVHLTS
jgi:hypothetical protein